MDGTMRQISYPKGSATVLLFFLSSCPTCHKMLPEWNRAYQRRPKTVNVIGVLLDKAPPGFFEAYPIAFPVVQSPGRDFLATFKVSRTPTTIRIAPGGKVEKHGVGLLDPLRVILWSFLVATVALNVAAIGLCLYAMRVAWPAPRRRGTGAPEDGDD